MPVLKQIKYSLIIYFLSLEKTSDRGYNTAKGKLNEWEKKKGESKTDNAEIAGTAQSETGGAGNGNHGAASARKDDPCDSEMAQDREENLHRLFEPIQLYPSPCGKIFRDVRNICDPALHASETGSPGRSSANSPDADAQGHSKSAINQKGKPRDTAIENTRRP